MAPPRPVSPFAAAASAALPLLLVTVSFAVAPLRGALAVAVTTRVEVSSSAPSAAASAAATAAGEAAEPAAHPSAGARARPESQEEEAAFGEFIEKYGRTYEKGSDEYNKRLGLFRKTLQEVREHNARPDTTWKMGINHFADETEEERHRVLGWRHMGRHPRAAGGGEGSADLGAAMLMEQREVPPEISWKHLKMSSRVLNQGSCGSCWAVTTASVLDAHHEINYGPGDEPFSVQELVSCVPNPKHCGGGGKCAGATVELGMQYVVQNGLRDSDAYPYSGTSSECYRAASLGSDITRQTQKGGLAIGLSGWRTLGMNREDDLLSALMAGPVGVSVAAKHWYNYDGGVFDGCAQKPILDHAVTLFGYKSGSDGYWLIRNSWGAHWGEDGFIRIQRSKNEQGVCGVDDDPKKGVGCDGGPSEVTVCGTCGILYDNVSPIFVSRDEAGASLFNRHRRSDSNAIQDLEQWAASALMRREAPETLLKVFPDLD